MLMSFATDQLLTTILAEETYYSLDKYNNLPLKQKG